MFRSFGMRHVSAVLLTAAVLGFSGCGDKYPPVYKVTGKVVFKGGKGNMHALAETATLQFKSVTDPEEMPGSTIGEDGTLNFFSMRGTKIVPGIKEGTYKARVYFSGAEDSEHPRTNVVDHKYVSFKTSPLQFTIAPGDNDIVIELEPGH
jgi:hypothetical protein